MRSAGSLRTTSWLAASMLMASATVATAEVTWPPDQLLPSFSTPAATQDLITLSRDDEGVLFASLKGVVNATSPRISSYEGGDEGKYTWLQSLGLAWTEPADKWTLITKYRSEIAGLVVYDDAQLDTINLATTIAGPRRPSSRRPPCCPP